jgi:hypothetical protein
MNQKVVDRTKAKEVRASIKDFKGFAKTILTLADGWIAQGTYDLYRTYHNDDKYRQQYTYNIGEDRFSRWDVRGSRMSESVAGKMVKHMQNYSNLDDADKMRLVLMVIEGMSTVESRVIEEIERESTWNGNTHKWRDKIYEYRYEPQAIAPRIDYLMKKSSDIYTTKEVVVTKPVTNLL